MKTFREIAKEYQLNIKDTLHDEKKYFAHTKNNSQIKESLVEHTELTFSYFLSLLQANNLENIIDNLIKLFVGNNSFQDQKIVSEYIKLFFAATIYFHDYGKVNENFQNEKMKNTVFLKVCNCIDAQHSILSAYLFVSFCFYVVERSELSNKDKKYLDVIALLFSYIILKHHGVLENAGEINFDNEIIGYLNNYRKIFSVIEKEDLMINKFLLAKNIHYKLLKELVYEFDLFLLIKLSSSLLTASDYYATNEFMIGLKCENFGVLDSGLKDKIIRNTYSISYNKSLQENYEYFDSLDTNRLFYFSQDNLNFLRQRLSSEIVRNVRKNLDKKLFYIEAPTGSGKTNLSLLVLAELLNNRNDINKIFYVFPFITLITQTSKFFIDNLKLENSEIAEIHSKAAFHKRNSGNDEQDAEYGSNRKNYIDNLFVNYPISMISHIKFFDILTSNEKEANYLLHRLANSIVIIDEIQAYNPTEWDKVNYLIQKYAECMNITFIIMSATLPKISKLFLAENGQSEDRFTYLVQNRYEYFTNPNFRDRVKFNFDYIEEGMNPERLPTIVYQHSEDYFNKHKSVKSIIEFVTKVSAHKFYEQVIKKDIFCDYEVYIITGTILEPRRREIISYLKSSEYNSKKVLVICTQVIEAGLDIDMDIGFKDKAVIDSEEQFAGRINRNATKTDSSLFIFDSKDSKRPYKSDLRYKQKIDLETYKKVLTEKDYDLLYERVFEAIKADNLNPYMMSNLGDFISQIKLLRFKDVKEQFQLIKDNTLSVFVPCEISKDNFTPTEIKFLSAFVSGICNNTAVDGEDVWCLYDMIITNKEKSFDKRIDLKIIASILSKYTFNVWHSPNMLNSLMPWCDFAEPKYGFIKFSKDCYSKIYSYETGLKADIETDCRIL